MNRGSTDGRWWPQCKAEKGLYDWGVEVSFHADVSQDWKEICEDLSGYARKLPLVLMDRNYDRSIMVLEGVPFNQKTLRIKIPNGWAAIDPYVERELGRKILDIGKSKNS